MKIQLRIIALMLFVALGVTSFSPIRASAETFDPSVCASAAVEKTLSQACQQMIAAFPRPDVNDIEQDFATINRYNFWKIGPNAVDTFGSPNGAATGQIAKGFNFVNVVDETTEGWLKTQDGKWIKRANATPTKASLFRGVTLPDNFTVPFVFVLDKSQIYASEYPGGPASAITKRVLRRYERANIFATATDSAGSKWYMIGANQWVKQTFLSVVQPIARPEGVSGRWIAVDLFEQNLVAYEDDKPVFATLISSGLPLFETPGGQYKVWARMERDGMSGAAGAPSAYALQSVPWVMYFNESISLHGTYWHDNFGYPRSHGCVNISISDARYVFRWMLGDKSKTADQIVNTIYIYKTAPTPGSAAKTSDSTATVVPGLIPTATPLNLP